VIRSLGDASRSSATKGQPGKMPAGPRASTRGQDADVSVKPRVAADDEREAATAALNVKGRKPTGALVPIEALRGDPRTSGHVDPYVFWNKYFKTDDKQKSSPNHLHTTVQLLNESGKTKQVHAVLLGYLQNHSDRAEPWMYIALALAIEMNQGNQAHVKQALEYAADLAQKTHNPNDLFKVADTLFYKGFYDRVGPLLDETIAKVPQNNWPLKVSVNLARETKDPVRMAQSLDQLLALGWPGEDAYIRSESRNQADKLAKTLREEGRGSEADQLEAKFAESKKRDVFIRLSWNGYADFDLQVTEPLGATAAYAMPRTVFGGALISNGYGNHPEEVYVCPRAFDGKYAIKVAEVWQDPNKKPGQLVLEVVTHEGGDNEERQVFTLDPSKLDKPIEFELKGGRRKAVLPYIDPVASIMSGLQKNPKNFPRPSASPKAASRSMTPGSEPRQAEVEHPKITP
jgi:hypothetical protein